MSFETAFRWRSRRLQPGSELPMAAGGWALLTLPMRPDHALTRVTLDTGPGGGEAAIELAPANGRAGLRLVRLPRTPSVIRLCPAPRDREAARSARVIEIGWLQAYPLLVGLWLGRNLRWRKGLARSLTTALSLIARRDWAEVRRRTRRQEAVLDLRRDREARPAPLPVARSIRKPVPQNRPIRTLLCGHNLDLEGAPISQFELTTGLAKRGVIAPIVFAPRDGPLRAWYRSAGIEVVLRPTPIDKALSVAAYERALSTFLDWARTLNVDFVYANTLESFYAIDAADRLGLPSLWNLRESTSWQSCLNDRSADIRDRALACFGLADRIIFVAEATRRAWRPALPLDNATVIPNSLDRERLRAAAGGLTRPRARQELGLGDEDIVVLNVGTLCARKRQKDLIVALANMPEAMVERVHLAIVGDRGDPYARELDALIEGLDRSRRTRIKLFPASPQIVHHYLAADIFVCTSRNESYPRVVLEAMAHGLAIVTTPVFGIREQVTDGDSALFFEPAQADKLSAILAELVADPALRRRIGNNARAAFDRLPGYEDMLAGYEREFRRAGGLDRQAGATLDR